MRTRTNCRVTYIHAYSVDFCKGCCSTDGHSGASHCIARVFFWCFSRNVTASISTENLAHIDTEITANQLMCQVHKNTTLWTLNSHLLNTYPVPLPLIWLVTIPCTFIHNWHTGWATTWTRFSHTENWGNILSATPEKSYYMLSKLETKQNNHHK
jgi:hypothetical protein